MEAATTTTTTTTTRQQVVDARGEINMLINLMRTRKSLNLFDYKRDWESSEKNEKKTQFVVAVVGFERESLARSIV